MKKLCDLGVRGLLKEVVLSRVSSDPRTNGMTEGNIYPADEPRLAGLNEIRLDTGTQLYIVQPGGRAILFTVSIPDETVKSYGQAADGKTTSFQRANRNMKGAMSGNPEAVSTLAQALQEEIAADTQKLNDFADSVLLSARAIEKHTSNDPDLAEAMSEVWTSLKQDPDSKAKIRMIAQFLSEAKAFMGIKRKQVEGMDFSDPLTTDGNEAILIEIEKSVDFYAPIVNEFSGFLALSQKENPVKKLVEKAKTDMDAIKSVAAAVHENSALSELFDTLLPSMEKARASMEEEVRKLEANKAKASPAESIRIDRKIAAIRKVFEELAPTKENIEKTLIGKNGDSTMIAKFLLSGMGNKDILVQGFMKKIKDKYQEAQRDFQEQGAEIGERFRALEISTGNIEEAFKDLHTEVKEYYYDEKTGNVEEISTLYFVSETDENWRTEYSKLRAELTKSSSDLNKKRQEGASADELRPLEDANDKAKTDFLKFRRENFETEYGDRYQAAEALLDTPVLIDGRYVTPREIRATYFDTINSIQQRYMALTGVPSEEDIEAINQARLDYEEIRSLAGKAPGTGQYRLAEVFDKHASEMKEMTDRWETTPASLDRFNTRKADIDKKYEAGEITKEERDRWYTANTTTVYNPKYWSERRHTVETLNRLAEEMSRITGHVKENNIKANFEEMEAISRKYRDSNSHIDGRKLTVAERQSVLDSEEKIEALKREMSQAYSGFLGADFQDQRETLKREAEVFAERIKQIRRDDPAMTTASRNEIADLRRKSRETLAKEKGLVAKYLAEKGTSKEDIKAFQDLYEQYMGAVRHLSELTESVETRYYYETYQAEMNKFLASRSQAERDAKAAKTNEVESNGKKYQKQDGEFYEVNFDGTLAEEPTPADLLMDAIFKKDFESSKWFTDNHFEAERWEDGSQKKKMVPIYSWRISEPRDKKFIKEHAPSIAWKRRVIKDEYRNPNFGIGADGLPKIKEGKHVNTGYEALRAKNPALWEFRDYLINEVFIPAQTEDLTGQRTLGMRVPTKERDISAYEVLQRKGKGFGRQLGRRFALNAQDVDEGLYAFSDSEGYEKKFIPVRFQGRLEADLVSRNIIETIGQYAAQARLFRARTELLDIGKALESSLVFQSHAPSSETLDKIGGFLGVKRRNKKRGENQRLDTIRNMIDMFVYGENISETSEQGKRIHKWISNLLGTKAALLFSEIPTIASTVAGQGWSIGGSSISQIVNLFGGIFQAAVRTAVKSGDAKFTMTDYAWATQEYLKNSSAFVTDIGKLSNRSFWTEFADFFDAREMHYINNYGEQLYERGLMRQVNMSNLSFAKTAVEHELMMTPIMAFARNYHIDGPDGKISLKDAFEVSGGRLKIKDGIELSDAQLSEIRGKIASLLRTINGAYGTFNKTYLEQIWWGKSMLFLRKWLVPMIQYRYSGRRYSVEDDSVVRGHIWESVNLAFSALTGGNDGKPSPKSWTGYPAHILKGMAGARAKDIAAIFHPDISLTMTESEKDSLRKTRLEILMLIAMWAAYRFALGWDEDDEDRYDKMRKKSVPMQALQYSLVKATSEQSTFMPLAGLDELGKLKKSVLTNTSPIIGDMWDIVSKDINWTDRDEPFFKEYKTSGETFDKGDTKIANHAWKLLGLTAAKESPVAAMKAYETSLPK